MPASYVQPCLSPHHPSGVGSARGRVGILGAAASRRPGRRRSTHTPRVPRDGGAACHFEAAHASQHAIARGAAPTHSSLPPCVPSLASSVATVCRDIEPGGDAERGRGRGRGVQACEGAVCVCVRARWGLGWGVGCWAFHFRRQDSAR